MINSKVLSIDGYEKVIEATDPSRGLHCIIAIHSTAAGPALGGLRIHPYGSREEALEDVLRLARGMTYKSAAARIPLGGGKAVLIADPKHQKSKELLQAFGEVINSLDGLYITAEDVGSTVEDMEIISEKTTYVVARSGPGRSGDPSRFTARGVYLGICAVAKKLWGHSQLTGKRIAVQGIGSVGMHLLDHLFWAGAELFVSDVDRDRVDYAIQNFGAKSVDPTMIHLVPCDIFSPCAMGGGLTSHVVKQLRCSAVAGGANNQLASDEAGDLLHERGVLYAPDFIINAGGLCNAAVEYLNPEGYQATKARDKLNEIEESLAELFVRAEALHQPTHRLANSFAEERLYEMSRCS